MNRTELQDALRRSGVPDDLYALPGVREPRPAVESHYLLERAPGGFAAAVFERGKRHPGRRFFVEDEACRWLYDELVFEHPAPRTLTAEEEQRAKERTAEVVREVVTLIRRSERSAQAATAPYMLAEGLIVDQFGQESGSFLYPDGTPFEQRSLPPSLLNTTDPDYPHGYHRYEVTRAFRVRTGLTAPAFGQPGGGVQFKLERTFLTDPPALLTVLRLLRNGYLRRVSAG